MQQDAQLLPVAPAPAADDGERTERGGRRRRRGGRGRGEDRGDERNEAVSAADAAPDAAEPVDTVPAARTQADAERNARDDAAVEAPIEERATANHEAAAPAASRPADGGPTVEACAEVEAYVLPLDELRALADGAGLEWVLSDAEKVRAVQEAMAAARAPARIPREPKAAVVVDEGPLILVETRKDLSQLTLPFETESR